MTEETASGRRPGRSGVREALIDVEAIGRNIALGRRASGIDRVLADVSHNAYGHGAVHAAHAARRAGAAGLLVAGPEEARALREAGILLPIYATRLTGPAGMALAERYRVVVPVLDAEGLADAAQARVPGVQLMLDIGGDVRGADDWRTLCQAARAGAAPVRGVMAGIDTFDPRAEALLESAIETLHDCGLGAAMLHVCDYEPGHGLEGYRQNTLRMSAALYGLSAYPEGAAPGLEPALTLTAPLVAVKPVAAGEGVSYGYTYTTSHDTCVLLVPLGYGDGIPRRSGNIARVSVRGVALPVAGRVAMDAMMLDGHALLERGIWPEVGDVATVIGTAGWPAGRWARALQTTSLDIVSRLGPRISRIER
ncbi:MAG TPA: alanine racemase C-terminal domain-containing protein [Microbacteriaceae bacterium]|nr:alanine racemase C-terminal domain-containing protein [Microbacteriaceae bacterium]